MKKLLFFLILGAWFLVLHSKSLIVLHTNDLHSQVEPTSDGNLGGFARLAGQIEEIKAENPGNVLLFNAGDTWQGTPYFNFFGGELEFDFLNRMKFDATTLGNHEFDNGIEHLAEKLPTLTVPVVLTNYDVSGSVLNDFVKPYLIIERNGLKIGVIGLLIDLNGLALANSYKGMKYLDFVKPANETSAFLKNKKKCDMVICLSHLGFENDSLLAGQSADIDLIIGGHTHKLLKNGKTENNRNGKTVIITQAQNSGEYLGIIQVELRKK
ncbi:MAG: metallophosphoesterase [Prevotellaceae bacterium]|jgi:5'-nucleotidase|nr:metallophosphoesterase [Prevotellaceae bacterium]